MTRTVLAALPEAIALVLLAALPAFVNLASEQMFEEEKSLLLRAGAVLAIPGVVLAWRSHRDWFHRNIVVLSLVVFTAMLVVASLAGIEPRDAFLGAHLRRHGSVTAIALAVMFVAMCAGGGTRAAQERLLGAAVFGSIWPSLYLLLQRAGFDPVQWVEPTAGFMAGSTFGNHVLLGGYLAAVAPLTAVHAWRSRSMIAAAALPLQLAALAASGSRGAWLAMAAGALVFALVVARDRLPAHTNRVAVRTLAIVVVLLIVVPSLRPAALTRQLDPAVGSARVRVLIWNGVIDLVRESGGRLWIGHGPESLSILFPKYYVPEMGRLEGIDAMPDRAHNDTLDTLVGAGVVGVVLQLAFFVATIAGALRIGDYRVRAGLLAAAVAHLVEIQFGIATVTSRMVFLCVAAMAARGNVQDPARNRKQTTTTAWLLLAAVTGAVSPLISLLPSQVFATATSGAESDLLASLWRLSWATPLLYGACFGIALLVSRSIPPDPRAIAAPWLRIGGVAAGALAVIPLSITPSRADIMSQAAADLEYRQHWAEAAIAYREAGRLQPRETHYLAGLGRALIQDSVQLKAPARAEGLQAAGDALARAVALAPWDTIHARHLASLLRVEAWNAGDNEALRAGKLAQADRLYAEAVERSPGLTSLWIEWARVDIDRRQFAEAIDKLNQALALDDTRVEARELRDEVERLATP
ncbi:MAG: O-antigen ligase family protein [Vicinamibacterales bacterium]